MEDERLGRCTSKPENLRSDEIPGNLISDTRIPECEALGIPRLVLSVAENCKTKVFR
jgi:hypothetical protein